MAMKKVKTAKLTGAALDWAVARARGYTQVCKRIQKSKSNYSYKPSSRWLDGGPLIDGESISVEKKHDGWWLACIYNVVDEMQFIQLSHRHLEAAMRCYVASKLGDEIEVPEELT